MMYHQIYRQGASAVEGWQAQVRRFLHSSYVDLFLDQDFVMSETISKRISQSVVTLLQLIEIAAC